LPGLQQAARQQAARNKTARHKTEGDNPMATKHIKTINTQNLVKTIASGGCGECQTSCQSACKTSCTVGNQVCRKEA
jgi:predicted ribosomally synthesized six-cysteine peptide SCIFF